MNYYQAIQDNLFSPSFLLAVVLDCTPEHVRNIFSDFLVTIITDRAIPLWTGLQAGASLHTWCSFSAVGVPKFGK